MPEAMSDSLAMMAGMAGLDGLGDWRGGAGAAFGGFDAGERFGSMGASEAATALLVRATAVFRAGADFFFALDGGIDFFTACNRFAMQRG